MPSYKIKIFNEVSIVVLTFLFVLGLVGPITTHAAGPATVNLGTAGNFVILSKTLITTTGVTSIIGNIGVSPVAATFIQGFGLTLDGSGTFSTSALVDGRVYAANYTAPTPATLTAAISAMEVAYTDASGRPTPDGTNLYAGIIGSQTFTPGLYKWTTNVTIPTDITLSGGANDVWIFQIDGTLDISANKKIILTGGAKASNIFWAVAGTTTLELGSIFEGNILAGPDASTIAGQSGATLHGRALGQTEVTLIANTVSVPAVLYVIKHVITDNGGTADAGDFTMNVTGTNVSDASFTGAESPGTTVTLDAGVYSVDENAFSGYTKSLGADCSGTIAAGETKTCTITNDDNAQAVSDDDEENDIAQTVSNDEEDEDKDVVAIKVTKKANPLSLSGPGTVIYTYKVTNEGNVALKNVSVKDDRCSPVKYVSGDSNRNSKLGVKEVWKYTCTKKVSTTETNRATARGTNGSTVFDHAKATVAVSAVPGFPNAGIGPDDKSNVPWNIIISIGIFVASFLFYSYLARKKLAI